MSDKAFAIAVAHSIPKGAKGDTGSQGEVPAAALATKETSTTASKAYAVGDYLYYNSKLYRVTADIASGGTITPNTNVVEAKLADDVSDVKSHLDNTDATVLAATGNKRIVYNHPNVYFTTSGSTWNPSGPSSSASYDAAVIDCSPGDVFTVSGLGGSNPKIWAFADASNNILARQENSTQKIKERVITAPANAAKLILNNKKSDYPDAVSYYGKLESIRNSEQDWATETINTQFNELVVPHFNIFDVCDFDDGYYYNNAGNKDALATVSAATPIPAKANTTYYFKNVRLYFSFFLRDNGTYQRLSTTDTSSGTYTTSTDGVLCLTIDTDEKDTCLVTTDQALYNADSTDSYYTINRLEGLETNHVFHVGSTRQYTSLLEGIIAAEQYKNSIVYVDPGTYDMVAEFKAKYGNDFFTSESYTSQDNFRGCPLTNGVHVIGYGGVKVTGGLESTDAADAISWWSIFNAGDDAGGDNGYGFTLENITIELTSEYIRYLVHDEYGGTDYDYINKYINVHFIVYESVVKRCIGGGLGKHGYIVIDNCTVDAPAYDETIRGINYHNNSDSGSLSEIYVKNCYIPNGTVGITWYGSTLATEKSVMYVSNCYLEAAPVKKAETESSTVENVCIVAWNNEIAE